MGVLFAFLNLDRGEYVMPFHVNLKAPDEPPYSTFCIWLLQRYWSGCAVMFMGDEDSRFDGWRDRKEADKTKEYWDEFILLYGDEFPDLRPEPAD